jgi:hypothetical protein
LSDPAAYRGPALASADSGGGEAPQWPKAKGKRVFVYLKATPSAGDVLNTLRRTGCPTLAYLDGATPAARQRLRSKTVKVSDHRLDVARAAGECDVAVFNGGHGVSAEMLLAGKPVLAVPLVPGQQMTGDALRRLGAGDSAPPRRGEPWEWTGKSKLLAVLEDERYAEAARAFAGRYAAFDPAAQRRAMGERAAELLRDPTELSTTARADAHAGACPSGTVDANNRYRGIGPTDRGSRGRASAAPRGRAPEAPVPRPLAW